MKNLNNNNKKKNLKNLKQILTKSEPREPVLTAGSSWVMVLSLITEGEGEVGRGREFALEPPPTLRLSTLRVLAGDTLLLRA